MICLRHKTIDGSGVVLKGPFLEGVRDNNMRNEKCFIDRTVSRHYCSNRFGHYGVLATMPLFIAFTNADLTLSTVLRLHQNEKEIPTLVDFEDSGFFTVPELNFLCTIIADVPHLSPEQIAADRLELLREMEEETNMCKSHAECLLKAVDYWELRFESKWEEWKKELTEAGEKMGLINDPSRLGLPMPAW